MVQLLPPYPPWDDRPPPHNTHPRPGTMITDSVEREDDTLVCLTMDPFFIQFRMHGNWSICANNYVSTEYTGVRTPERHLDSADYPLHATIEPPP